MIFDDTSKNLHQRYIIVGAGISGLYAAKSLKTKYPDSHITILEQRDTCGGRILSEKCGNFILEHGPMRFEPELQPKFKKLIHELQIETIEFSPYTSTYLLPPLDKFESHEVDAIIKSKLSPAFALVKYALNEILKDLWDLDVKYIEDRETKKTFLKENAKFNGHYLHNQGIWDVFSCVLSKEAIDFIQSKGSFYHMLSMNPNSADMICFMIDILDTVNDKLITIKNGSYEIISSLEKQVKAIGVDILFNCEVIEFVERNGSCSDESKTIITLKTKCNQLFIANRAIFTLQQRAYEKIQGFSNDIKTIMRNSVMLLELFKLFVIFTNPPFNEWTVPIANHNANKIPCRELHYSYDKLNKLGMIQIYGDIPSINFWNTCLRGLQSLSSSDNLSLNDNHHSHETTNQKELLMYHIDKCLNKLFPSNNCEIKHFSIVNWSNEPWCTGVHFWKPGYQSTKIMKKLHKIGNVHICGETFSTYQGFIEGALISVDQVIQSI